MFILLTAAVNHIRLGPHAPAGMVAAIMPDLGRELVAKGKAVPLTLEDFQRRLRGETRHLTLIQASDKMPP